MWKAGTPIADATVVDALAADDASSAEPEKEETREGIADAGIAVVGNTMVPFDRPEQYIEERNVVVTLGFSYNV